MINISPSLILKPSGRLYRSSAQFNLVDMVDTLVELNAITSGFVDGIENTGSHRITPGIAGLYLVHGMVTFDNCVANKSYGIVIKPSNGAPDIMLAHPNDLMTGLGVFAGGLIWFDADDYVELYASSYSGDDTVDIMAGQDKTFLEVQRFR